MNGTKEIAGGFVIARSNTPVLLELGKEVLNQVTRLVHMPIVFAWFATSGARRNHDGLACPKQRLNHPLLCVIRLIGQHSLGWGVLEQNVSPLKIVRLPRREVKSRGIAKRINSGVNLGAQPATTASNGLVLRSPPFAPELCWWARTMVESIMTYRCPGLATGL